MMDTQLFTDGPTLPTLALSTQVSQPPDRDPELSTSLVRLVDRGLILPDDVIHTYAGLEKTQIRLRKLITATRRRLATDQRKMSKLRSALRDLRRDHDYLSNRITWKEDDIRRYEEAVAAAYALRRLIEQGALCPKRPHTP
jgi:hypothetical protein